MTCDKKLSLSNYVFKCSVSDSVVVQIF